MEESLHEWEHKYPSDPWLAKSVAGLVHMYSRVPTTGGRAKMHAAMDWLQKRYSKTKALIASAKAEVEAADKAAVAPAEAATTVPVSAPSNAPQPRPRMRPPRQASLPLTLLGTPTFLG